MRCRSSSDRVVEILLLFFSYYIKKAVSQIGNVVITIKPYVMKPATEKLYELLWKIKQEYSGIIPKENIESINLILLNTIKNIKQEELEHSIKELHL